MMELRAKKEKALLKSGMVTGRMEVGVLVCVCVCVCVKERERERDNRCHAVMGVMFCVNESCRVNESCHAFGYGMSQTALVKSGRVTGRMELCVHVCVCVCARACGRVSRFTQ